MHALFLTAVAVQSCGYSVSAFISATVALHPNLVGNVTATMREICKFSFVVWFKLFPLSSSSENYQARIIFSPLALCSIC